MCLLWCGNNVSFQLQSSTASKPTPNAVKDPLKVKAVAPDVTSGSNSGT